MSCLYNKCMERDAISATLLGSIAALADGND